MAGTDKTTIGAGWALVWPPSYQRAPVVQCGANVSETAIWAIGLGWPSGPEIDTHKRNGVRAVRVQVVEEISNAAE